MLQFAELARDWLHSTGKYAVEGGIISPVHDAYGKKVHEHNYVKTAYMCYSLMWLHPVLHAATCWTGISLHCVCAKRHNYLEKTQQSSCLWFQNRFTPCGTNCCKRSYVPTPSLSCVMGCGHTRLTWYIPDINTTVFYDVTVPALTVRTKSWVGT